MVEAVIRFLAGFKSPVLPAAVTVMGGVVGTLPGSDRLWVFPTTGGSIPDSFESDYIFMVTGGAQNGTAGSFEQISHRMDSFR